jgi:hypothetical protein
MEKKSAIRKLFLYIIEVSRHRRRRNRRNPGVETQCIASLQRTDTDVIADVSRMYRGMSKKVILSLFLEKSHLIISMLQMANLLKRGFLDTLST